MIIGIQKLLFKQVYEDISINLPDVFISMFLVSEALIELIIQNRHWQTFSVKAQIVNTLDIVGHYGL